MPPRWKKFLLAAVLSALVLALAFFAVAYKVGSALIAPWPSVVKAPPDVPGIEDVTFPSESGSTIHGWFVPGEPGHGAVLALHGIRASRVGMAPRVRLFSRAGFATLVIDFQAHGESPGRHITMGYLESRDARAAVEYLRSRAPGERIGVDGISMGGAAAVLANPPLKIDALVLEQVYPTLLDAVKDRIAIRLGPQGKMLAPALALQMRPRLGFGVEDLRPISVVPNLHMPKLFIVGSADQDTPLAESRALFDAAAEPKELWVIEGAAHVDLFDHTGQPYVQRLRAFFEKTLRAKP